MPERIDISNLAMGAIIERTGDEVQKALENIADRNTDWKKKRKITVDIVLQPRSEKRDDISVDIQVKNSIAPYMPIATQLYIGTDSKGNVVAEEYSKGQMIGQMSIDTDTGEILNDKKVVNMKGGK
jgi:hypothetical protein